jgi:hypothetical protein
MFFLAFPTPLTGFFVAFADAGAFHSPWAKAPPTPAPVTTVTAATMANTLPSLVMLPPLEFVTAFTTSSPFTT